MKAGEYGDDLMAGGNTFKKSFIKLVFGRIGCNSTGNSWIIVESIDNGEERG